MIWYFAFGLIGLGLALFVIGLFGGRPELTLIGAIVIVGIGGVGVLDGYEVATGQVQAFNNTSNTTTINTTFQPVKSIEQFPVGVIIAIIGGLMFFAAAEGASEL